MSVATGIIGVGAIGRDHARRVEQVVPGARVAALFDIDRARAKAVREAIAPDAEVFETGEALIASPSVGSVLVASTGASHERYVLAAIAAGKPCFCEKPLATTAAGARRIVDAEIAGGGRLVQVGFMRRYDAGYRMLKRATSEAIGRPLMVHAAHRNLASPEGYVSAMAIHDTLIHEIDVLRWLLEDDYVSAQVILPRRTSHAPEGLIDPQIVLLETVRGVRIDVEVFVNCRYGYDIRCEVVGEEGTASLPEPMAVSLRRDAALRTPILTDWKERFIESYDAELGDFMAAAARGVATGPSAWDGYAAAVAADACLAAQASPGRIIPIKLPARPTFYD